MREFKGILLFDFDGTIVDSFPIVLRNANKVLEELKLEKKDFTPDYVKILKNKTTRELIKEFGISLFKLPTFVKRAREFIKDEIQTAKVFKGMPAVIKELSNYYLIGILTTNSEDVVNNILKREKINSINFIDSGTSLFGKSKKLKKIKKEYKTFLKEKGLGANSITYIGDEVRDVQACKKAGIPIMAVTWGYNSRAALAKETNNLIDKPEELLRLVPIAVPARKKAV